MRPTVSNRVFSVASIAEEGLREEPLSPVSTLHSMFSLELILWKVTGKIVPHSRPVDNLHFKLPFHGPDSLPYCMDRDSFAEQVTPTLQVRPPLCCMCESCSHRQIYPIADNYGFFPDSFGSRSCHHRLDTKLSIVGIGIVALRY